MSVAKRLRCSPPDVTIIVGPDGEEQKTYLHYGVLMAYQSKFFDQALSIPMREQATRTIRFPAMEPLMWEEMMLFLEPENGSKMEPKHVTRILPMYEMYEFESGRELCNGAIARYFRTSWAWNTIELPETIRVMHMAHEYKLEALNKCTVAKLGYMLRDYNNLLQLSQADVSNLIPLFPKYDMMLWKTLYKYVYLGREDRLTAYHALHPDLSFLTNNVANPLLDQVLYLNIQVYFAYKEAYQASPPAQNEYTIEEITAVVDRLLEIVRSRNLSNMLEVSLGDIATLSEQFPKFTFLFKDFQLYLGREFMQQENVVETLANDLFPLVVAHKVELCKIEMHVATYTKCIGVEVLWTFPAGADGDYDVCHGGLAASHPTRRRFHLAATACSRRWHVFCLLYSRRESAESASSVCGMERSRWAPHGN